MGFWADGFWADGFWADGFWYSTEAPPSVRFLLNVNTGEVHFLYEFESITTTIKLHLNSGQIMRLLTESTILPL